MNRQYVANGEVVDLELDTGAVAVRFREPAPHSMRAAVTAASDVGPFPLRYELPREKYTLLPIDEAGAASTDESVDSAMDRLNAHEEVARAAPVYRLGANRLVATDRVLVGFDDPGKGRAVLKQRGLDILHQEGGEFQVRLGEYEDPFDVAAELMDEPGVQYAEPDFVIIGPRLPRPDAGGVVGPMKTDPLLSKQYALRLTQAVEAAERHPASPDVVIAVLDEGVDTLHEDLALAIRGGYDACDDDEYQEPDRDDAHGTACAGLAAATGNNGLGIRGVAAGCGLLAVRIAYSDANGNWVTSSEWIARAIDWSWRRGAWVLSNSWGGGAPSTRIRNAFERARTQGRGGRGCVLVIAAGNASGPVTFPGTIDNVLVVAASNADDEPKTRTSSDGESWWGTCFGPQVSVAAPGVHNWTTDISGSRGYSSGAYVHNFNGTSSATPIVAGAAALVLSANPSLSEREVREIICATADRKDTHQYPDGRNDYMGYGRVNVLRAVERVLQPMSAWREGAPTM